MNEIDYFKVFVLCSDDVVADVDHLHVKIMYLMCLSYIVIKDTPAASYYLLFFIFLYIYLFIYNSLFSSCFLCILPFLLINSGYHFLKL
jgi:hypothetical protein